VKQSDKYQLLILILIAIALESSLGLIQYFFFEEGGGDKVGVNRPHGVFLQPNVMASFMATGLAIALFISTKLTLVKSRITTPLKEIIYFT